MKADLKRILVFRIGHLGDTIASLPALWSIRDAFPKAHLALLSNSDPDNPEYVLARSVLPETGLFDDWIVYSSAPGPLAKLKAYPALVSRLRAEKFDAAFYLMPRVRSRSSIRRDVLFLRSAGISEVHGAEFLRGNTVDFKGPRPLPHLEREADFLVRLVTSTGIEPSKRGCDMLLTQKEKQAGDRWLAENCGAGLKSGKLLALSPGSKWQSKIWSEKKYVTVLRRLLQNRGLHPVVFGGAEDADRGERILEAVGCGANAAGKLSVREGTAAMRKFALYLGNDTGAMHMAAAAGIPCVAIFAAIDFPGRWYPYGDGHRIFRVPVECEGCHTPDCFNDHLCLESVLPDDVYAACKELLASRTAP